MSPSKPIPDVNHEPADGFNGDSISPLPGTLPTSTLQVKCVDYASPHLCVSFNDFHSVLVYKLSVDDDSPSVNIRASLVQTLRFDSAVLDCKFSENGSLFVLVNNADATSLFLRRFRAEDADRIDGAGEGRKSSFVGIDAPEVTFDEGVEDSLEALKTSLSSAACAPSLFAILTKSKVDNVKAYLESKEKRLAGNNNARWGGKTKKQDAATDDSAAEAKKIKTASC